MCQKHNVPEFPVFSPIQREHKAPLTAAFQSAQLEISEATFAYQWVWRSRTHCRLSCLGGSTLLMLESASGQGTFLLPPVTPDRAEAAQAIVAALEAATGAEAVARVPESLAELLRDRPGLSLVEQRERADYVHAAEDLRELPGQRFHAKRNLIRQFEAACPGAQYLPLDETLAQQCAGFCREWFASHPRRDMPSLQREVEATLSMLQEWQWLGLCGGVLLYQDRVVAFALGEPLNKTTFVVRVEKADTCVPGSYQAINRQFARHAAAQFQWINREQDLGVPGLRRAKQSYCPHHLLSKYEVRLVR